MTDEPVKRTRARAVNNHDEREADGQQMIFKAFAFAMTVNVEPLKILRQAKALMR